MIEPFDNAGALQRPQVANLFNNDDQRWVAARVLAKAARRYRIKISADRAFNDLLGCGRERLRERQQEFVALLQQSQRRLAR